MFCHNIFRRSTIGINHRSAKVPVPPLRAPDHDASAVGPACPHPNLRPHANRPCGNDLEHQIQSPGIAILDLMLPGMDGFEVCRRTRSGSSVPIITLTARSDDVDIVSGLEAGADD